jgi:hypothetical protein
MVGVVIAGRRIFNGAGAVFTRLFLLLFVFVAWVRRGGAAGR